MIRSLLLFLVFVAFLAGGFAAPFVFSLGYIWVDGFRPQEVSYSILTELPVSMIMAVAAIGGYFVLDRRFPPKPSAQLVLTLLLAVWVTLTTNWAEVPDPAWIKWDWAFKTIVFSAFIPYVFRSSIQIEAFALIWMLALSANILPVGAKTILSGGGYGHALGLVAGNSGFAEGSTLAAISLMMVPIFIFLRQHGQIIPRTLFTSLGYIAAIALSIAAAVGTYERTALVGAVVMGGHLWWHARRKLFFGVIAAVTVLAVGGITSQRWIERMSTVQTFDSEFRARAHPGVEMDPRLRPSPPARRWVRRLSYRSHPLPQRDGGRATAYDRLSQRLFRSARRAGLDRPRPVPEPDRHDPRHPAWRGETNPRPPRTGMVARNGAGLAGRVVDVRRLQRLHRRRVSAHVLFPVRDDGFAT